MPWVLAGCSSGAGCPWCLLACKAELLCAQLVGMLTGLAWYDHPAAGYGIELVVLLAKYIPNNCVWPWCISSSKRSLCCPSVGRGWALLASVVGVKCVLWVEFSAQWVGSCSEVRGFSPAPILPHGGSSWMLPIVLCHLLNRWRMAGYCRLHSYCSVFSSRVDTLCWMATCSGGGVAGDAPVLGRGWYLGFSCHSSHPVK